MTDAPDRETVIRCLGSWIDGGYPGPYAVTDLVRSLLADMEALTGERDELRDELVKEEDVTRRWKSGAHAAEARATALEERVRGLTDALTVAQTGLDEAADVHECDMCSEASEHAASVLLSLGNPDREAMARIINPHAFAVWKSMYDRSLRVGETEAQARTTADFYHLDAMNAALAKADAILALSQHRTSSDGEGSSVAKSGGTASPKSDGLCKSEEETWPAGEERYVWHEAYGGCSGCDYDADALIDQLTGRPVQWRCHVCGDGR